MNNVSNQGFKASDADLALCWTKPTEWLGEVDLRVREVFMWPDCLILLFLFATDLDALRPFPRVDWVTVRVSKTYLNTINLE